MRQFFEFWRFPRKCLEGFFENSWMILPGMPIDFFLKLFWNTQFFKEFQELPPEIHALLGYSFKRSFIIPGKTPFEKSRNFLRNSSKFSGTLKISVRVSCELRLLPENPWKCFFFVNFWRWFLEISQGTPPEIFWELLEKFLKNWLWKSLFPKKIIVNYWANFWRITGRLSWELW